MSPDPRDVRFTTDESGNTWLTDADGRPVYDGRGHQLPGPPEARTSSGFTTYDTSRGHCGLCGSLTCSGNCFR